MNSQKQLFSIHLACNLMAKSIDQVLEQYAAFDPQVFTQSSVLEDDYKNFERLRKELLGPSLADPAIDDELFFDTYDAHVGFHCHFQLEDYQAFSYVGVNFVNNTAVGCIVSLGGPTNPERYGSELEVTKVFLVSLEELYLNGRIQEETEPGTRVYTWKKDDITVVSFVASSPSGEHKNTNVLLSVQVRNTQLHPGGAYFELLYHRACKSVQDVGYVIQHRKDEPLEKVYVGRRSRYHLNLLLSLAAIGLGITGIVSLVLRSFSVGIILIILAILCAFLPSELHDKVRRDYRQKRKIIQLKQQEQGWDDSMQPTYRTVATQLVRPKGISRAPLPPEVPSEFTKDYQEACLVLTDSPKASAALSRRCLQNLLREKGGTTKKDLVDQIQEVLDSRHLPSYLAQDLDAVRNIGNFAAHPTKSTNTDEIIDVEQGEAERNLNVLEGLFDFYFVQPAKFQDKKDRLNEKLQDAGKPPMKTADD